jgi:hypothetical protein
VSAVVHRSAAKLDSGRLHVNGAIGYQRHSLIVTAILSHLPISVKCFRDRLRTVVFRANVEVRWQLRSFTYNAGRDQLYSLIAFALSAAIAMFMFLTKLAALCTESNATFGILIARRESKYIVIVFLP